MQVLSALEKVFLDEAPAPGKSVPLTGFQNEVLSFQVAFRRADEPLSHSQFCSVQVRSPIAPLIRVRRVHHVPVGLAAFPDADDNYLRRTPGLYPDLLTDAGMTQLRLYADQWQTLWVDVEPGTETAPGTYPIEIALIDSEGNALGAIATEATILKGLLPEQTLIHTKWLHCDCLADAYGEPLWTDRYWAILGRFIRLAARRGINTMLTPIHTPPLDTQVGGERMTCQLVDVTVSGGTYRFGFDRLRRWVALCEESGIRYFEMAHLFTQWGARFTPKIVATVDGLSQRLFGWDVPAQSESYRAFLAAYLPALTAELSRLGIAERTFFHISDEPAEEHLEDYRAAKAMAAPYLDGFPIRDALSSPAFYRHGVIDRPIPSNDHVHDFLALGMAEPWTYYCVGQYRDVSNTFIAMPSARNRILGVQLYKYGIQGFLQWGYNFYYSQFSAYPIDPFGVTDGDGFSPSGDPFQVYPGPDGTPLESLRMLVTQQALYDLRALRLLESLQGRDAAMALVEEGLDAPITFSRYPKDAGYLLRLRHRVNEAIVRATT